VGGENINKINSFRIIGQGTQNKKLSYIILELYE